MYKMTNLLSPIEKIVQDRIAVEGLNPAGTNVNNQSNVGSPGPKMIKVPSQKLSVIIKRRNR